MHPIRKHKSCFEETKQYLTHIKNHIGTALKVVSVFGLIFGLAALPLLLAERPPRITRYEQQKKVPLTSISREQIPPAITFPAYTPWFMNPGLQLARLGTSACNIQETLEKHVDCERITTHVLHDLELKREFNRYKGETTRREKGFIGTEFTINGVLRTLHFRIHSLPFENYKKCLEYIDENIIKNEHAFLNGPEKTVSLIKAIHRILTQNSHNQIAINPGTFRTSYPIHLGGMTGPEIMVMAKKRLTAAEFTLFQARADTLPEGISRNPMGDEEEVIWGKLFHIAPPPDSIQASLTTFAKELENAIKEGTPLEELMSFAHTEIARISPFETENLQVARLFMYTLGIYFGNLHPVIIHNRTEYLTVVLESMKNPTAFTDYLTQNLLPWTTNHLTTLSKF